MGQKSFASKHRGQNERAGKGGGEGGVEVRMLTPVVTSVTQYIHLSVQARMIVVGLLAKLTD